MSTILDAYELYMHVISNKSQNTVMSYHTQLQVFLLSTRSLEASTL